jgi:hypothetical protein
MTTAAENFLVDSENEISATHDYLVVICAVLSAMKTMDETQAAAMYRLAHNALDEIKGLKGNFNEAFQAHFGSNTVHAF